MTVEEYQQKVTSSLDYLVDAAHTFTQIFVLVAVYVLFLLTMHVVAAFRRG